MYRRFSLIDSLLLLVLFKCEQRKVRCNQTTDTEAGSQTKYRASKQCNASFRESIAGSDPRDKSSKAPADK